MRAIGNGYIRRVNEGVTMGAGVLNQICPWMLATNDTAALVEAANYFDALAAIMPVGSQIFASLDLDGTPVMKHYMVTANTGSAVTVAIQTVA